MSLDIYLEMPKCPACGRSDETFNANITHNLSKMAMEAGLYKPLWHPEEAKINIAADLIGPLAAGISLMKSEPARFKAFNAPNGWGTYDDFVPWLERLLAACTEHPSAIVTVSI